MGIAFKVGDIIRPKNDNGNQYKIVASFRNTHIEYYRVEVIQSRYGTVGRIIESRCDQVDSKCELVNQNAHVSANPKYQVGDLLVNTSRQGIKILKVNAIIRNRYELVYVDHFATNCIGKVIQRFISFMDNNKYYSLDRNSGLVKSDLVDLTQDEKQARSVPQFDMPNFITLQDAIKFDIDSKKPKLTGIPLEWSKEGRCPQCGEMGRYSLSQAICSKHGAY